MIKASSHGTSPRSVLSLNSLNFCELWNAKGDLRNLRGRRIKGLLKCLQETLSIRMRRGHIQSLLQRIFAPSQVKVKRCLAIGSQFHVPSPFHQRSLCIVPLQLETLASICKIQIRQRTTVGFESWVFLSTKSICSALIALSLLIKVRNKRIIIIR